jgi:hypothetical protein
MQIQGLNLDKKGNIWVSTRGGISKFNGEDFKNFEEINCLPKYAHHTAEDAEGNIWILGSDALIKFNGNDCERFDFPDWINLSVKSSITILSDGKILQSSRFGGDSFIFNNGNYLPLYELFDINEAEDILDIALDTSRNLQLIGYKNRIEIFREFKALKTLYTDSIYSRSFTPNSLDHQINKYSLLAQLLNKEKQQVEFFVLTDDLELKKHCKHIEGKYDVDSHSRHHNFFDNAKDLLVLYNSGQEAPFLIKGVKSKFNQISSIKKLGDYTFVLSDKGLFQLAPEKFFSYSDEELPFIWSVIENDKKEIVIGSYGEGLRILQNGILNKIETTPIECSFKSHKKHYSGNDQIYFHPDKDEKGNIYFSTGAGITKLKGENATAIYSHCLHKSGKAPNASLYSLWDREANALISCQCDGAYWINEDGEVLKKVLKQELKNSSCLLTAIKKDDAIYFGYRPHIAKFYNEQLEILSEGKYEAETFVSSFLDHRNTLWFGGANGLYYLDNDNIEKSSFLDGQKINAILQYSPDKVFFSLTQGLLMVNLERYYETGQFQYRLFDQGDGYSDIEPDQNGLYLDSQDRLWINSLTGLSYVYVNTLEYLKPKYEVSIESINNKPVPLNTDSIQLPKGINYADVQLSLIGLDRPNNITYSHSVDKGEFTSPKPFPFIHLENMPSGLSHIDLKVFDADNKELAFHSFDIEVDIPFYKEPWWPLFLTIAISLALLLLVTSIMRSRAIKKEKENLEEQNVLIQQSENQLADLNLLLQTENKSLQQKIERSKENVESTKMLSLGSKGEYLVNPNSIIYAQSERNRLRIELEDKPMFVYITLKEFKGMLPSNQFVQINRSNLVNIHMIKYKDVHQISMANNHDLNLTKTGRTELEEVLEKM